MHVHVRLVQTSSEATLLCNEITLHIGKVSPPKQTWEFSKVARHKKCNIIPHATTQSIKLYTHRGLDKGQITSITTMRYHCQRDHSLSSRKDRQMCVDATLVDADTAICKFNIQSINSVGH